MIICNYVNSFLKLYILEMFVAEYLAEGAAAKERSQAGRASDRACVLPPYPHNGTYTATVGLKPGDSVPHTSLTYSCEWGYRLFGEASPICFMGIWFMKTPTCESQCKPLNSTSVEFKCYKQNSSLEISCNLSQDNNSRAKATCKDSYHSELPPRDLNCIDGSWDYIPICTPACGRKSSVIRAESFMRKVLNKDGNDPIFMNYPWTVYVFVRSTDNEDCALTSKTCWILGCCDGLLIGPKVVLSVADRPYRYRQDKLMVRAGDLDVEDVSRVLDSYQQQFVKKIIFHPQYYDSADIYKVQYNAALLVMEEPFTLADNIAFVCLPPPDLDVASVSCKAAGRGIEPLALSFRTVVDWNYVNHDQCQWFFRQNVLPDSYSCAGNVLGEAHCSGAEESLMCIDEDHYYARGLSTWSKCDNVTNLLCFTDVVKLRKWIDQEMRANGFTTDTYTLISYRK